MKEKEERRGVAPDPKESQEGTAECHPKSQKKDLDSFPGGSNRKGGVVRSEIHRPPKKQLRPNDLISGQKGRFIGGQGQNAQLDFIPNPFAI